MSGKWQAVQQRFSSVHSDHRNIARGAAWVAGFVLIGKLAAAARDVAIAWRYGMGEAVDAYQLGSTLVFWLPTTLVATLTVVLVPMLVRLQQDSAPRRTQFLRELQGHVLLGGLVLGAASVLLCQLMLTGLAGSLSAASRQMTWHFTLGMAPLALPALMFGAYAARLMAQGRQANTLLEALPPVAIALLVAFWPPGSDVAPLLWGTVLGFAAQALLSSWLASRADGESAPPRFTQRSSHWPEFYKAAGIMAAGQVVMSLVIPLDQYVAGQLGDGAIALLGYANRIIGLLLGVGAIAFSRAALPILSQLHAFGETARAGDIALKWAAWMLAAGALVAVAAWALAPWAIRLLFERGAFTSRDTQQVTEVFNWGLVQVPFYLAGLVLVQLLASRGRYGVIAWFGASNFAVKLALNLTLPAFMGVSGIALATSLMYAWSAACLFWFVARTPARSRNGT